LPGWWDSWSSITTGRFTKDNPDKGGGKDKMRIESKDLWQSAYVLAKGGRA